MGLWAVPGGEWGPAETSDSLAAIEAAFEAGVNFFDTADVYGVGHSEELLGRAMAGRREQFIVATKIGWTGFDRDGDRSQYDTAVDGPFVAEGAITENSEGGVPGRDVRLEGFFGS